MGSSFFKIMGTLRIVVAVGNPEQNIPNITTEVPNLADADAYASVEVPTSANQPKLTNCKGVRISALLPDELNELSLAYCIIVAADGLVTDPIVLEELKQGIIVYGMDDGSPLTPAFGGPLRVWFPDGCAVQERKCGMGPAPVNVKDAIELRFRSMDSAAV